MSNNPGGDPSEGDKQHRTSVLHDANLSYQEVSAKKAQNFFLLNKKKRLEKIEQLRSNKRFKSDDIDPEEAPEKKEDIIRMNSLFTTQNTSIPNQSTFGTSLEAKANRFVDPDKKEEEEFANFIKSTSNPLEICCKIHELLSHLSAFISKPNFASETDCFPKLLHFIKTLRKCLSINDIEKFEMVACILLSDCWEDFFATISSVFPLFQFSNPAETNENANPNFIMFKDMKNLLFFCFNELLTVADGEIQVEVCWCITNLCCSIFSSNVESVISHFGPKLIQYLLENDDNSSDNSSITFISINSSNFPQNSSNYAPSPTVHQNTILMEQCCGAIGNGAGDNEGSARDSLIKMGAIHPLLQIVKTKHSKPSLQMAACWALSNLLKPHFKYSNASTNDEQQKDFDNNENSLKSQKFENDEDDTENDGIDDEIEEDNEENDEDFGDFDKKLTKSEDEAKTEKNSKFYMSEDEKFEYFFCEKNAIDIVCLQMLQQPNSFKNSKTPNFSRIQTEFAWILSCLTTHNSKKILSRFLNETFCRIVEEKLKFTEIRIEELCLTQNIAQNNLEIQKSSRNEISEMLLMQIPLIRFFGNIFSHPLIEQPQILQILKLGGQTLSRFCIKKLKQFFFLSPSSSPSSPTSPANDFPTFDNNNALQVQAWKMINSNFEICLVQTKEILWFLSTLFLVENEDCLNVFVEGFGFLELLTRIARNLIIYNSTSSISSSNSSHFRTKRNSGTTIINLSDPIALNNFNFSKEILNKIDRKTKYEILRECCFSILNLINSGKYVHKFLSFSSNNAKYSSFHPFGVFTNSLLKEAIFFQDVRTVDTCFTFLIFVRQTLGKEAFIEFFQESEGNLKKSSEIIEHFVFHKEKYTTWMGADLVNKSHPTISKIYDELEKEQ